MRAVFMGTPEFAVPCLEALAEVADVVAVVCQPDKPVGRKQELTAPPVKRAALARGIDVMQPTKLRTGEFAAAIRALNVDLALVVAYGRILPKDVLDAPRLGCVNVHASLLPKYRGAAPIAWAIVHGERETGVTLMQMDEGMDTGNSLAALSLPIDDADTHGTLSPRLSKLGADLVRTELPRFVAGELASAPQDGRCATSAPILEKAHGRIDWTAGANGVHNLVRGMNPWPMAFTHRGDARVIVHTTRVHDATSDRLSGRVLLADKARVLVGAGRGVVELVTIQLEGRKPVAGAEWARGRGVVEGDVLV